MTSVPPPDSEPKKRKYQRSATGAENFKKKRERHRILDAKDLEFRKKLAKTMNRKSHLKIPKDMWCTWNSAYPTTPEYKYKANYNDVKMLIHMSNMNGVSRLDYLRWRYGIENREYQYAYTRNMTDEDMREAFYLHRSFLGDSLYADTNTRLQIDLDITARRQKIMSRVKTPCVALPAQGSSSTLKASAKVLVESDFFITERNHRKHYAERTTYKIDELFRAGLGLDRLFTLLHIHFMAQQSVSGDVDIRDYSMADLVKYRFRNANDDLTNLQKAAVMHGSAINLLRLKHLYAHSKDTFWDIVVRYSILLHRFLLDYSNPKFQHNTYQFTDTRDAKISNFMCHVWPWVKMHIKYDINLEFVDYMALSELHPYWTSSRGYDSHTKLRTKLTAPEIRYVCSVIDYTEPKIELTKSTKGNGNATRLHNTKSRNSDVDSTTAKNSTHYIKKGHFLRKSYKPKRLLDPSDIVSYNKWLGSYHCTLEKKKPYGKRYRGFIEPNRRVLSCEERIQDSTPKDEALKANVDAVARILQTYRELNGVTVEQFIRWLKEKKDVNKPQPISYKAEDFLALSAMEMDDVVGWFIGYIADMTCDSF